MPDQQTTYRTEPCRSCDRPVIWAITERLRPMPVDPEPGRDGNVALTPRPGQAPLARVLKVADRFGRTNLRTSHFATCPQGAQWRRPRGQTP